MLRAQCQSTLFFHPTTRPARIAINLAWALVWWNGSGSDVCLGLCLHHLATFFRYKLGTFEPLPCPDDTPAPPLTTLTCAAFSRNSHGIPSHEKMHVKTVSGARYVHAYWCISALCTTLAANHLCNKLMRQGPDRAVACDEVILEQVERSGEGCSGAQLFRGRG